MSAGRIASVVAAVFGELDRLRSLHTALRGLKPERMITSLLRPTIKIAPSGSCRPRSPVLNQPSGVSTSAVASGAR